MANYYSKQWSSATPGYIIFLIDQSNSMRRDWFERTSFAEFTAYVVNKTINELIATNASGESIKDRVFISIIGYGGAGVRNLRSDYLSKYAESPITTKESTHRVPNNKGEIIVVKEVMPIFLQPEYSGWTPMAGAFDLAKKLIHGWMQKKPNHPVPVIINISDGAPEGETPAATELETRRTILFANEIMNMVTQDGPPLIFNVHISENSGRMIQFPENQYELEGDQHAELLFKISSRVPDIYKKAAKNLNLGRIRGESKGFISNSSAESFVDFINFGSSIGTMQTSV